VIRATYLALLPTEFYMKKEILCSKQKHKYHNILWRSH
jgi:hypothetical protein